MENEVVRLWNKKAADLTVGDNVKVVGIFTVIGVVAPMAIMASTGLAMNLYDKIRSRKNVVVEVVKTEEV